MKKNTVPEASSDERNLKTAFLGAIALAIVLGLVVGGIKILKTPVTVQAKCNVDLDWMINQPCDFAGENLRHCPLPTNVKCDLYAQAPLIALLGGGAS